MSDGLATEVTRSRGRGVAAVIAMVVIAFVVGLALMALAARQFAWFGRGAAPTVTSAPATSGATGFTPAQPLSYSGEPAAAPQIDPNSLVARQAALAGQLASLEARLATVSSAADMAGGEANRSEALLVAFAARRAIDRGLNLGYLEDQLRLRFGTAQPQAVGIIVAAARQPVTIEDLRQSLDALAPDLSVAVSSGNWLTDLRRGIGNLVVLRKAGTPSPAPNERLDRIRRLLDGRQIDAARAEVARLPGAASAGNWLAASQRYVLAHRALDRIENAAILGQATPVRRTPA